MFKKSKEQMHVYILMLVGGCLLLPLLIMVRVGGKKVGRWVVFDSSWKEGRVANVHFEEEGEMTKVEGRVEGVGEGVFWLEANKGARTWRTETRRAEGGVVEWGGRLPIRFREVVGCSMCLRAQQRDEEGQYDARGTRVASGRVE